MDEQPVSMQIRVQAETRAVLRELQMQFPMMTTAGLVGRLADWFADQPADVQVQIMDTRGDAARVLVERRLAAMAAAKKGIDGLGGELTLEQAAELIHSLVDYMGRMTRTLVEATSKPVVGKKKG